ncbi:hypothetical protein BJ742DRAFT_736290 [Cladochytrium replicatum]|nr:hypothetical protein BJ742DRAFT_736290 [Cladochytrium replicatum]
MFVFAFVTNGAIVKVSAEDQEPPHQLKFSFMFNTPMASAFERGRLSDEELLLTKLLEKALQRSRAVDTEGSALLRARKYGKSKHSFDERTPIPLSIHHIPVSLTFAFFESEDALSSAITSTAVVLDPTHLEEQGKEAEVTAEIRRAVAAAHAAASAVNPGAVSMKGL